VVEGPACSRLAGTNIGAAGMEALARALPPSLTTLYLGSTCGVGCLLPLSVGGMRCGRGHALRCRVGMWCAVLEVDGVVADRVGRGAKLRALVGLGLVVEGRLARGLQATESEQRVWRRWRARCRRV
jgi:hypothetical protein